MLSASQSPASSFPFFHITVLHKSATGNSQLSKLRQVEGGKLMAVMETFGTHRLLGCASPGVFWLPCKTHTCIRKMLLPFDAVRIPYQGAMKMRSRGHMQSSLKTHRGTQSVVDRRHWAGDSSAGCHNNSRTVSALGESHETTIVAHTQHEMPHFPQYLSICPLSSPLSSPDANPGVCT